MSGSTARASLFATTSHPPTKRGRGRPRKTPAPLPSASPSQSPATDPAPVKRRKLRQPATPSQDNVFAIKDIVDEKFVDGKHFFKIDWEDNPATGESFEPTWVST